MENHFENLRVTRKNILHLVGSFSLENLNEVPPGFSNNIFWNMAHVVVTQQILTYRLSGLDGYLDQALIDRFRKGTRPEQSYQQEELNKIKDNLLSLVDRTEADYHKNAFTSFNTYETSYGITLHSTEEAIVFNNMHEALHLGYIMAMKKYFDS